jgi:hypothetical protein
VLDWAEIPGLPAALVFVEVAYVDCNAQPLEGRPDTYQLSLAGILALP